MSFLLSTLDSSLLSLGGDLWSPFDIIDADGTIDLPIAGGKHLEGDVVGSHFADYDSVVNLAHFKGHMIGGFGDVIKNMSISTRLTMKYS